MMAHHDNIEPYVLPAREGIIHCPAPEDTAIHLLPGEPTPRGSINDQNKHPASRPAHLRQNIQLFQFCLELARGKYHTRRQ